MTVSQIMLQSVLLSLFAGLIASFPETIFSVSEDGRAVEVCVSLSAEVEAASLMLATRDGSGTS